jgi:hypothetical protein
MGNCVSGKSSNSKKYKSNKTTNNNNDIDNTIPLQVIANSYIGFTKRQIFSLKMSWKAIDRQLEETGIEIFTRYHNDLISLIINKK